MNIILLLIWVIILLLCLVCFYLNMKILDNYVKKNTLVTKTKIPTCNYKFKNLPNIDLTTAVKCKMIDTTQTYIYNTSGSAYEISENANFYVKACSGFCTKGTNNLGDCLDPIEKTKQNNCLGLLTPDTNCAPSTASPIAISSDNKDLYVLAPINSLNLCSVSA